MVNYGSNFDGPTLETEERRKELEELSEEVYGDLDKSKRELAYKISALTLSLKAFFGISHKDIEDAYSLRGTVNVDYKQHLIKIPKLSETPVTFEEKYHDELGDAVYLRGRRDVEIDKITDYLEKFDKDLNMVDYNNILKKIIKNKKIIDSSKKIIELRNRSINSRQLADLINEETKSQIFDLEKNINEVKTVFDKPIMMIHGIVCTRYNGWEYNEKSREIRCRTSEYQTGTSPQNFCKYLLRDHYDNFELSPQKIKINDIKKESYFYKELDHLFVWNNLKDFMNNFGEVFGLEVNLNLPDGLKKNVNIGTKYCLTINKKDKETDLSIRELPRTNDMKDKYFFCYYD